MKDSQQIAFAVFEPGPAVLADLGDACRLVEAGKVILFELRATLLEIVHLSVGVGDDETYLGCASRMRCRTVHRNTHWQLAHIGRSGRRSAVGQVRSRAQFTDPARRQAAPLATRLPGVIRANAPLWRVRPVTARR